MHPKILLIDGVQRPQYYADIQKSFEATWTHSVESDFWDSSQYDYDLALLSDEFNSHATAVAYQLARHGIPVLHVPDGIIEWRNTWSNPRSLDPEQGMPFLQPSSAHKIACFGRAQARLLESWGNVGKCEIVGASRFEKPGGRHPRQRKEDQPFEILILTASTPGFTPQQISDVKSSLQDLKNWFDQHSSWKSQPVRAIWRITGGLDKDLGVQNTFPSPQSLDDVLNNVDALITTPSTSMLQGMLQGIPVALLDYHNSPHYTPAAWSITAPCHMEGVLPELLEPPPARMLYQDSILHDSLECRTPAMARMVALMESMIRIGRECRERKQPLELPRRILPVEPDLHHWPAERFDFTTLYPQHSVFSKTDLIALQSEVGHLQTALSRDRDKIIKLHHELSQNHFLHRWIARLVVSPSLRLRTELHKLVRKSPS